MTRGTHSRDVWSLVTDPVPPPPLPFVNSPTRDGNGPSSVRLPGQTSPEREKEGQDRGFVGPNVRNFFILSATGFTGEYWTGTITSTVGLFDLSRRTRCPLKSFRKTEGGQQSNASMTPSSGADSG